MDIPIWVWITFTVFILVILTLDLTVFHIESPPPLLQHGFHRSREGRPIMTQPLPPGGGPGSAG